MDVVVITYQMLALFLLLVTGYVAYKAHVTSDEAIRNLTTLVLNVSLPAQILISFLSNRGKVSNMTLLEVTGISLFCYIIYFLVAVIFIVVTKAPKKQWGTYVFMLLFGNVGFMGYPVIQAVFGMEAMIYAVVFNVVFSFMVYSIGIVLIGGKSAGKFDPKVLLNAPMIASLAGLALFFTPVPLPEYLENAMNYLGNLTTPLAMIILGGTIAKMNIKELFDDWRIYIFTIFRLVLMPLAVLITMNLLHEKQYLIRGTAVVLAATPVATNATMLAIQYHGDEQLVSKGIFFSTVLSVVSIPIVAMFL